MDRIILHSDCNNFYASVESVARPELKNMPVAVAGDKESRHGIILAKNEIAKKFGVKTAEPIWQAKKKCPGLVTVPPHHELYKEYSEKINRIYIDYTDQHTFVSKMVGTTSKELSSIYIGRWRRRV